ncbi:MAG: methylmalonyl-CoA carboxyltransferase [Chloroflexi bacterium RBG_16_48_7]|nr:MAG: methylmalonyl-CoA carboxyltransferase [Chloroflexi bacterium RBG_16_48_7]
MIIENQKTQANGAVVFPAITEKISDLNDIKARAHAGGGPKRIQAQHAKGKLTARERIDLLLDTGTFEEIGALAIHNCTDPALKEQKFYGDSVVTGYGNINGKKTFVYAQDFTVLGGTLSLVAGQKICRVMDMAASCGCPIVGLLDSGGARIQEGISSLIGCGEIFTRNTLYSGVIPQISVVMGPCAGAAVCSPALTDFIFMVNDSGQMYVTGPLVVKAVTGEDNSAEDTGGASVHSTKSGNCHFVYNTEEECLAQVRRLLGFLPQNNKQKTRYWDLSTEEKPDEELLSIIPSEPNKPYDMIKIIKRLVDDGDFMEVHERFARNIIVGFGKIGGRHVGIVAQQPQVMAGSLTVDASDKAARFIRFCDCFNIPLITLVDVPGYMPGVEQEHHGIIRHGAKILYAYAEATTPKISIVVRKAYGGAYIAMSSKSLRGDINYAWPTAEFAVMGPEGAVNIIYRDIISKSPNPEAMTQSLINEYREKFANPYTAAANNYIDDVIDPRDTRQKIIKALMMLDSKSDSIPTKKHGNMPL